MHCCRFIASMRTLFWRWRMTRATLALLRLKTSEQICLIKARHDVDWCNLVKKEPVHCRVSTVARVIKHFWVVPRPSVSCAVSCLGVTGNRTKRLHVYTLYNVHGASRSVWQRTSLTQHFADSLYLDDDSLSGAGVALRLSARQSQAYNARSVLYATP